MKPTVCLCMIVKNESKIIERCLTAAKEVIDTWVITDTGSTDGTQDMIRLALDGIPGELHELPWVNFGYNRTLNIRHARGKADYLLLLDADLEVLREGEIPPLTAGEYLLCHDGDTSYRIPRLVRGDLPWRYEGVTHEYLTCDQPVRRENLDALVIRDHGDGGSRHDKFERDARLLNLELQRDPDNPRTVFYLAQTMRDLGHTAEAIDLYERRVAMGGWEEELYYSLYQIGLLKAAVSDWPHAAEAFTKAWEIRPQRLEACYQLASRLRKMERYHTAHALLGSGIRKPLPSEDILFTQPWVYRWGLLFEYSITAYWVGDYGRSVVACDELLSMNDLPEAVREQVEKNRVFAVEKRRESCRPADAGGVGQ
ncbi:glycosyltransferase involved in cell wall biosynthesis [Streptomyces nodosus]|nr:glycosyltransferase [Streptomyces nodosus]MBB4792045.1 glycosyltransferase involved in cell wall biosynthesis [Streptomyces nodosus]